MAGIWSDALKRKMRMKYRMAEVSTKGTQPFEESFRGSIKFNRLAGYGCRFGVIELSFVRVDGDAEAVKVRMMGDFGFGGNGRTFTPPSSPTISSSARRA
jgi:hypothetical protein